MTGVETISPPDLVQTFDNEKLVDALYAAREQLAARDPHHIRCGSELRAGSLAGTARTACRVWCH